MKSQVNSPNWNEKTLQKQATATVQAHSRRTST